MGACLCCIDSYGVVQAIYAIGQQAGYIASNHHLFPITGLMGNPGQMGGFQAVAFLSAALLAVPTASLMRGMKVDDLRGNFIRRLRSCSAGRDFVCARARQVATMLCYQRPGAEENAALLAASRFFAEPSEGE